MYDRQVEDDRQHDPEDGLLYSRLKDWFNTNTVAWQQYRGLGVHFEDFDSRAEVEANCPYRIEIVRRLKLADEKLG
jgi:hypothetical protein